MGSINIFKPQSTFRKTGPLINLSNIDGFSSEKNWECWDSQIPSQASWVRSKYATSLLYCIILIKGEHLQPCVCNDGMCNQTAGPHGLKLGMRTTSSLKVIGNLWDGYPPLGSEGPKNGFLGSVQPQWCAFV